MERVRVAGESPNKRNTVRNMESHIEGVGFQGERQSIETRRRFEDQRRKGKSINVKWDNLVMLFVDDLSREMTWDWLYQIFKFEGQVINVYVSHKMRHTDSHFGFVRFNKKEEAIRA